MRKRVISVIAAWAWCASLVMAGGCAHAGMSSPEPARSRILRKAAEHWTGGLLEVDIGTDVIPMVFVQSVDVGSLGNILDEDRLYIARVLDDRAGDYIAYGMVVKKCGEILYIESFRQASGYVTGLVQGRNRCDVCVDALRVVGLLNGLEWPDKPPARRDPFDWLQIQVTKDGLSGVVRYVEIDATGSSGDYAECDFDMTDRGLDVRLREYVRESKVYVK